MRVLRALRSSWRGIALAALLGLPLGVLVVKTLLPREYSAETVLVWEPSGAPAGGDISREFKTMVDTLKLPALLAEVRHRTQLSATLESLSRRIDAEPGRESNVLILRGRAESAEQALRLTEAVTQVFLEGRVATERGRAEDRFHSLGEELSRGQAQLTTAWERYDEFRSENGIADLATDQRVALEEQLLLRTEANRSHIEMESEEARAALLHSAAGRQSPQMVLTEAQAFPEERKLAELRTELAARRASLSADHPEVQGITAAVEALAGHSARGPTLTDRTVGTNPQWTFLQQGMLEAKAGREAAWRKWQAFTKLELSARERTAKLSSIQGQASRLLDDIHRLEARLRELGTEQQTAEAQMNQPVAGLRVMNAAELPSRPTRSYRLVALAFPAVFGLLATLVCAARALRGLKLWSASEVAFWGRGPVVAASSGPANTQDMEELILDLEEALSRMRGSTLLLALTPSGTQRALELASRLDRKSALPRDGRLLLCDTPQHPQALRRLARQSTRVLVLVEAGIHSVFELTALSHRLGREDGIGFVVLGLGAGFAQSPDQVGDVSSFWQDSLNFTPPLPHRIPEFHS